METRDSRSKSLSLFETLDTFSFTAELTPHPERIREQGKDVWGKGEERAGKVCVCVCLRERAENQRDASKFTNDLKHLAV